KDGGQAWEDVEVTNTTWAHALQINGDLDAARQLYLDSIEASKKVGGPAVNVIISELEAWRIDIMQGQAGGALPEVETRLAQVEAWWQQHCCGRSVPEAPNSEELARALIGALDIAMAAHVAMQDWEPALRRL